MYPELIKDVQVLKDARFDLANGDLMNFSIEDVARSLAVLANRAEKDKPGHPDTLRLAEISKNAQDKGVATSDLREGIDLAVAAASGTIGTKSTRPRL